MPPRHPFRVCSEDLQTFPDGMSSEALRLYLGSRSPSGSWHPQMQMPAVQHSCTTVTNVHAGKITLENMHNPQRNGLDAFSQVFFFGKHLCNAWLPTPKRALVRHPCLPARLCARTPARARVLCVWMCVYVCVCVCVCVCVHGSSVHGSSAAG